MAKKKTPARPALKKRATPPATNGIQGKEPPKDPGQEKTQAWERGKAFKTLPHVWEKPEDFEKQS